MLGVLERDLRVVSEIKDAINTRPIMPKVHGFFVLRNVILDAC